MARRLVCFLMLNRVPEDLLSDPIRAVDRLSSKILLLTVKGLTESIVVIPGVFRCPKTNRGNESNCQGLDLRYLRSFIDLGRERAAIRRKNCYCLMKGSERKKRSEAAGVIQKASFPPEERGLSPRPAPGAVSLTVGRKCKKKNFRHLKR